MSVPLLIPVKHYELPKGHFIKNLTAFQQAQLLLLFCISLPVGMFLLSTGAGGRPQVLLESGTK